MERESPQHKPCPPFRIQEKQARVLFDHTHFALFAESDDDSGPLVVYHVIGPTELDTPPRESDSGCRTAAGRVSNSTTSS